MMIKPIQIGDDDDDDADADAAAYDDDDDDDAYAAADDDGDDGECFNLMITIIIIMMVLLMMMIMMIMMMTMMGTMLTTVLATKHIPSLASDVLKPPSKRNFARIFAMASYWVWVWVLSSGAVGVQDVASKFEALESLEQLDAVKVSMRRQFFGVKAQGLSKIEVQETFGTFVVPLSPIPRFC